MNKKRFIALVLLSICTVLYSFAAAGNNTPNLTAEIENGALNVQIDADTEGNVFVAMYSGEGKIVYIYSDPVSAAAFSNSYPVQSGTAYAKVFFWDKNMSPVTDVTVAAEALDINCLKSDELITKNPGKGWVRYGLNNEEKDDGFSADLDQKVVDYSSTAYFRYTWNQLEPEEDKYNLQSIKNAIAYWKARGIKFAFGIMSVYCKQESSYTPEWVFEKGAAYKEITYNDVTTKVPVFDDEIYMAEYRELLDALAEEFDGNDDIAWIDIRSYGDTGEFHVINLPEELALDEAGMKEHIEMHIDAFKKTPLAICGGVFYDTSNAGYITPEYIKSKNLLVRNDGANAIMDEMDDFQGFVPTISETAPAYPSYCTTKGWDNVKYLEHFKHMKQSYMDIGQWSTGSQQFVKEQEPIIRYLTNKMGYHFVLNSVKLPRYILPEKAVSISFNWVNEGITYLYENCNIDVALIDSKNNVIKTFRSDAVPTKQWAPETEVQDTVSIELGDVENGEYVLAVGLKRDNDAKPDYQIGNTGKTADNWYVFAKAVKNDNGYIIDSSYEPQEETVTPEIEKITNAGFEQSFEGWERSADNAFSITSATASEGNAAVFFTGNTSATLKQKVYILNQALYDVSFDVKADSSVTFHVEDMQGNVLGSILTEATGGSWKTYKLRFDLFDAGSVVFDDPINEPAVRFVFKTDSNTKDTGYIDNVRLTKAGTYEDLIDPANYIRDYGAETGVVGWVNQGSKLERTTETAYSGLYSFKLTTSANYGRAEFPVEEILSDGPGYYTLTGYIRAGDGQTINKVSCYAYYYTGISKVLGDANVKNLGDTWTKFSVSFRVTQADIDTANSLEKTPVAVVGFKEDIAGKAIYFDDVKIVKLF